MRAMRLYGVRDLLQDIEPLSFCRIDPPSPGHGEVLLKVHACGVCHTEIDEIEGRTPPPIYPVIPGHEIVGTVEDLGPEVDAGLKGTRVGVGWFFSSCGQCSFCRRGVENLCSEFRATGRDADGGYAEYMIAPAGSVFPVPPGLSSVQAAPLLCAGAIGYRSIRLSGISSGDPIGLTGFGGSGHLMLSMVRHMYPDSRIYVFARNGREREFALELGATWAGDTAQSSPELLSSIVDTTPVWKPPMEALKNLLPGGRLVINAIRKEEVDKDHLLTLDYTRDLWMEREIKSVANVSPGDIRRFLLLAGEMGLRPQVEEYPLEEAGKALAELKAGGVIGAKVLNIEG